MLNKPDISIIGAGCVGSAIAQLAYKAGYRIAAVSDTEPSRAKRLQKLVDAGKTAPAGFLAPDAAVAGELVLLTVPDDNIASLCKKLAECDAFEGRPIVAHCSGALGSDALAPAAEAGCPTGSMHPLQTFPDAHTAMKSIPGTYFFIEGSESATAVLRELATSLGGIPAIITSQTKAIYHAAAVMASNYFVTLTDAAAELLAAAGLTNSQSLDALEPLMRATFENVFAKGNSSALTGPIARGDVNTIERHLQALAEVSPETRWLYRAAGLRTISLAEKNGTIDSAKAERLLVVLEK